MDEISGSSGTVDDYKNNCSMQAVKRMTGQRLAIGSAMIPEDGKCTRLGGTLGRLGDVLEASQGRLGASGGHGDVLGPSWDVFGRFGAFWGRPGRVLGAS